jgi:methionine-S-sulfoxide reductase
MRKTYFAGGCFWGTEYWFMKAGGVKRTSVGFMGGNLDNLTYPQVKTGATGHLECVKVEYDTTETDYENLVKLFFETHDFTQTDRQGAGYRFAIFVLHLLYKRGRKKIAETCIRRFGKKDMKLQPASAFWIAEDYHQQYYDHKGAQPYCRSY